MVIELPIWSGKGAIAEEQSIQQTVSRAIFTGCRKVSFKPWQWHKLPFLPSEATTQLIPTPGILGEHISPWPEILPIQHKVSASPNYFLPSLQKSLHKLPTEQHRSSHPNEVHLQEDIKMALFSCHRFRSRLHSHSSFMKRKSKSNILPTDFKSWHKWPMQTSV